MGLSDEQQRLLATNPSASYLVQAPAGSGKTEILTQRYLGLLSRVAEPEQIIALTFTKKAASEMRNRIVLALVQAATQTQANSAHQQRTLDLANLALKRDEALNWNLLHLPNRLKIITIDSLCQQINQAIPLVEKQIPYAKVSDLSNKYYLEASRLCIHYALETPEYQQAIKILLLHVDNRQERLLGLFSDLLAQRDQWLVPLFEAKSQDKAYFEKALKQIEEHELTRFKQSLPTALFDELIKLSREMATLENNPKSSRHPLINWFEIEQSSQEIAAALASLILTKDLEFRTSFDHHVGLKKGLCPNEDYDRLKQDSKNLLAKLAEFQEFQYGLIQVSRLPSPEYDLEQWEVLQALFALLPLLVGHLHLLFSEHNEVDFTAISQFALKALGNSEQPTDLALFLDNSIHHLLVDEFQDTSIGQFKLLSMLVQGWQEGDGKTLFIVGDPMQSIYRFRQAEVGLFYRAKTQGIGPVSLRFLELSSNFRSNETIVNWVNHHFSKIFPKDYDMESGAVPYHASSFVLEDTTGCKVEAFQCKTKTEEARQLIELVRQELDRDPNQSLAILVRSRSQLMEIIKQLRSHQIPYQGTEIDLISSLPHLSDALSLTKALLSPACRLSWLALLRSPCCGLALEDVHIIASFNTKQAIFANLLQLNQMEGLSEEGLNRARFFIQVMQEALLYRFQMPLSDWVDQTLKSLNQDKLLDETKAKDLEQFFQLLDRFEQNGTLPNLAEFQKEFNSLYSKTSTPSNLQVMTIHKSKGLEFDTVFLPGLGARPNRGNNPMFRWLNLPTKDQSSLTLISPIRGAHNAACALYDYLSRLDEEKSSFEAQRLLYVAATRAKSRLYLLDGASKSSKDSFLSFLKHQAFVSIEEQTENQKVIDTGPKLVKLPVEIYRSQKQKTFEYTNPILPKLNEDFTRLTGIISHQLLQWICDYHPKSIEDIPWSLAQNALTQLGLDEKTQEEAFHTIQIQIKNLFNSPKGSWIIAKHKNEHNEYELLVTHQNQLVTRIIDRCFIENNKFWIIDFKTGKMDDEAVGKHHQQLEDYAKHLGDNTTLPIYCGLYYLSHSHWIEWAYESNMQAALQ